MYTRLPRFKCSDKWKHFPRQPFSLSVYVFFYSSTAHLVRPFHAQGFRQAAIPASQTDRQRKKERHGKRQRQRQRVIQCRTSCQMKPILLFSTKKQQQQQGNSFCFCRTMRISCCLLFHCILVVVYFVQLSLLTQKSFAFTLQAQRSVCLSCLLFHTFILFLRFHSIPFVCQRLTKSVNVLFCLLSVVCSHCIFAHCAYFSQQCNAIRDNITGKKKSQQPTVAATTTTTTTIISYYATQQHQVLELKRQC